MVGSTFSYSMYRTLTCPCPLLPYLLVTFLVHLSRRPSDFNICVEIFKHQLWNRKTHLDKSCKMSSPKNTPSGLLGAGNEADSKFTLTFKRVTMECLQGSHRWLKLVFYSVQHYPLLTQDGDTSSVKLWAHQEAHSLKLFFGKERPLVRISGWKMGYK